MGNSIRTSSWRYTIWLSWDGPKQQADWSRMAGSELYNMSCSIDSFDSEFENLAEHSCCQAGAQRLRQRLHAAWLTWQSTS